MAQSDIALKRRIDTLTRKQAYRALIEKGSDINDHIETSDLTESFNNILGIVESCERLIAACPHTATAENAAEYFLDAQVMKMSHDLVSSTADKLGNVEFSDDDFAICLLNFINMENGLECFDILVSEANKTIYTMSTSVSMLGTFDSDAVEKAAKEKAPRQKRKVATMSELKAPENISTLTRSDKGAEKFNTTHIQIQNISNKRGGKPFLYYELITHPKDFMITVDNAFQVSFLVRDGLIGLKEINDDVYIYVVDQTAKSKSSISTPNPKPKESVQAIFSINPTMWRENVKKYKIKHPMLDPDYVDLNSSQASQSNTQSMMEVDDSD